MVGSPGLEPLQTRGLLQTARQIRLGHYLVEIRSGGARWPVDSGAIGAAAPQKLRAAPGC
jgi:hypothetical protein